MVGCRVSTSTGPLPFPALPPFRSDVGGARGRGAPRPGCVAERRCGAWADLTGRNPVARRLLRAREGSET